MFSLLTDCQWKESLIEMELWTKLASTALKQEDYKLVGMLTKFFDGDLIFVHSSDLPML